MTLTGPRHRDHHDLLPAEISKRLVNRKPRQHKVEATKVPSAQLKSAEPVDTQSDRSWRHWYCSAVCKPRATFGGSHHRRAAWVAWHHRGRQ